MEDLVGARTFSRQRKAQQSVDGELVPEDFGRNQLQANLFGETVFRLALGITVVEKALDLNGKVLLDLEVRTIRVL
jgi:hypothetical protein